MVRITGDTLDSTLPYSRTPGDDNRLFPEKLVGLGFL